ncbi:putative ribosomally synthesized peptide [Nitrospirillum amazonense]|uniref:Putative ribosomally synthesized peptide n=1 Tax=Nitrospirillum amazonense TaxID=28077 RepID=A0A560F1K7_9PROT|nr:NHLP leader peptide family RiPP precursor [Nitrospirillum amazonense]TWB15506.1 putative ribosomally synthesized peptide [Nitrospirillum amazonense]
MTHEEKAKAYGRVVAKAWADDAFKARLLADPVTVLKGEGVDIPAGMAVTVAENTATACTLVLPARPADLSDEELDVVSGGFDLAAHSACAPMF